MRPLRLQSSAFSEKINVTPLIDVVMVLIIFYLMVGNLAAKRQADVDLPTSEGGELAQGSVGLVLTIRPAASGSGFEYLVGSSLVSLDELAPLLESVAKAGAGSVVLRGDRDLPFEAVAPVLSLCRDSGVTSVRLATQRAEDER
ncbi:MAG: biopolymer transporter ExbD [Planctomycetota bacterium]|nr:biopolymer transporter ExbD [Planctomycetota bacterium]